MRQELNRDLGQFFTPEILVDKCVALIKNQGRLLEPSCGDGAFAKIAKNDSVFIEIDKKVIKQNFVKNMDFFDYPLNEKFATIIGNPPYVDNALFAKPPNSQITVQANLYLYFIEKCFHHLAKGGELIFIVPREFIKLTSAQYINNLLVNNGTITDYYDFGDQKFFDEAAPNICIFRYEKDNFSRKTKTFNGEFDLVNNDGILSFAKSGEKTVRFGDLFEVKVGATSGADDLFASENGEDFVFSKTNQTGKLRKLIYERYDPELEKFREKLLSRGIKKFNENNWWKWGRPVNFRKNQPRIYVNCRTRFAKPFFLNSCEKWDGSILAIFPRREMNLAKTAEVLNEIDWESVGLKTGGRFYFGQKSLSEAIIDGKLFE